MKLSPVLLSGLRQLAAGLLGALLLLTLLSNFTSAVNLYQDAIVTLSARPLGMGGTGAALSGPAGVFYNPAGLAGSRGLTLMHNHSARHFPGSREGRGTEWDQLDCDTQALVAPLPLGTYAHGFSFMGENGYDFRSHPVAGAEGLSSGEGITAGLGYPRENLSGTESYDAYAVHAGLPFSAGISLRRNMTRFTPEPGALMPAWTRIGEGMQWGLIARIAPGLDYGRSDLKLDYDYTLLLPADDTMEQHYGSAGSGDARTPGLAATNSRLKQRREGYAFRPVGWLTLAADTLEQDFTFRDEAYMAVLHLGDQHVDSGYTGGELQLGNLGALRWGSYDGRPTVGCSFNPLGLKLSYAEVKGLLPHLVGAGQGFEDVHVYGAETTFY